MRSLPVGLFLVAFLTICSGAPSFNRVGRPRFFLRDEKRRECSIIVNLKSEMVGKPFVIGFC